MSVFAQKRREVNLLWKKPHKKNEEYPDNTVISSKYTLITFFPKNLFEQFRRMVNFFFLCLIVVQVSIDIPVNPISYIAAFAFVIGVTGVKQGYEDWCRHKADNKVNFAKVNLVDKEGKVIKIQSKDIRVGQLLKLDADESVPCDLLLIASQQSISGIGQSYCQITTVNLDGESNLKMRFCAPGVNIFEEDNSIAPENLNKYFFRYDIPNSDLYNFSGQITSPTFIKPNNITMENILLRGSRVKNSGSVYAIAIYTGKDTRLSMNANKVKVSKFSTIEHTMNRIVIGMFICLLILSSVSVSLSFMHRDNTFDGVWYIPKNIDSNAKHGITIFFSYLVLLCYMIPVSLSVTFELQKLGCSSFFSWDSSIVCPETGAKPLCNTSDLNEELGQVEYLFTDKTGTLTDNDLIFRCCSINGIKYTLSETLELCRENNLNELQSYDENLLNIFLRSLAVCHTVRVLPQYENESDQSESKLIYQANSLDEEVLVKMAHQQGVQFLGGEEKELKLKQFGKIENLTILATLEFDSDRKCMSTFIKDEMGEFYLFCKGAESSILPKCVNNTNQSLNDITEAHVNTFAKMGYRTLVMAYKKVEKDKVESFLEQLEKFRTMPEKLQTLYSEFESDLTLLGCTGVEDKLQAGVPETLRMLTEAGIKILMLTGDKLETATSVASSCGLINTDDIVLVLEKLETQQQIEKNLEGSNGTTVLVIDGQSFEIALEHCKDSLRQSIIDATSVIFCRMAPLQKSQVVSLIKNNPKMQYKTCAVGDGGNDCAMLRESHLGIGIIGKEGLQAARESDFAIGRFRFLQEAILVHGYWYYHRLATLITYFFYRGVFFIFQIFFYGFDSGFSAQTIFHSTFVMMFTISFTSVPVLIQGLTEQPYSKEELINNRFHYKEISRNELMSFRRCSRWLIVGIWHALICYYIPKYVWLDGSSIDDYGAFSLFISSVIVTIADTKILTETRYFTWLSVFSQLFSYLTMVGFYMIICHAMSDGTGALAFSYIPMLQQVDVWITLLLVAILSVVPDLIYFSIQNM